MKRQQGFSLVEIMVSLAILAVLVVGVVSMVSNAQNSATREVTRSAQNGKMRAAVEAVQNSLSNADSPLMYVPATKQNGQYVAAGNEIIYSRTDDRGPDQKVIYVAERIRMIDEDGKDPLETDKPAQIVFQRVVLPDDEAERTTQISDLSNPQAAEWGSAPSKVLLDEVQPTEPLFAFMKSASEEASVDVTTGAVSDVGLVDVELRRDSDGSGDRYAASSLKTSVYLSKVASKYSDRNVTGCD